MVLRSTNSLFDELVIHSGKIQINTELIILARNDLREPKACWKLLQRDNYNGVSDQNVGKRTQRTKISPKILVLNSFILFPMKLPHSGKTEELKDVSRHKTMYYTKLEAQNVE